MIRPARIGDLEIIINMIEDDCKEMGYPFNRGYVTETITSMIQMSCLIFVMEKKGEISGLLAMIITPNMFDPSISEMREFIWYADVKLSDFGRARVMIELLDFMLWLANEKRIQVHIALPDVPKTESVKDLITQRGFIKTESYYKLEP